MKNEKPLNVVNQIAADCLKKHGGRIRIGKGGVTAFNEHGKIIVSCDAIVYGGSKYIKQRAEKAREVMNEFGCNCSPVKHTIYGIYTFSLYGGKNKPEDIEEEIDEILEEEAL